VFISSICFGLWLTLSTVVLFAVVNNSDGFEGTGVENLCVGCMKDHCEDFFTAQYQNCAVAGNSSVCGEIDGSVMKTFNKNAIGSFRTDAVKSYWSNYDNKYDNHEKLFKDLADVHLNDLPGDVKPDARESYEQFLYQYTLGVAGTPYGGDRYQPFDAAQEGKGVGFIGNDRVPVTNEVSFCDFVWGFSNYNSTWTKNYKAIGPGQQRKEGVLRSIIYTQVSISGQALIFVTRTAGTNNWFFAEKPANLVLIAFVFAQIVASAIGWVGFSGYPTDRIAVIGCGGGYTLIAWIWAIVWHIPLDLIKFAVNYLINKGAGTYSQTAFTSRINAGHPTLTHSVVTNQQRSIRASRTV
jgi:H+-transporting ATPase